MLNSLFHVSPQHAQVGSAGGAIESKNNNRVSDLVVDSCVEELSVQHCFSSAGWTEHQRDKSTPPQHKLHDSNTNVEVYLSPRASFKQPGCAQTSGEQFLIQRWHHFLLIWHSFFSDTPLFRHTKMLGQYSVGCRSAGRSQWPHLAAYKWFFSWGNSDKQPAVSRPLISQEEQRKRS